MNNEKELIKEIPTGIWRWYNFTPNSSILLIDDNDFDFQINESKITIVSPEKSHQDDWVSEHQKSFDYIISIAILEKYTNPIEILSKWKTLLKPTGCLLLGFNNFFHLLKISIGLIYFSKIAIEII